MSPMLQLRKLLVYALTCSLFVTGLIATRQSHASNNSPGVNQPSEEETTAKTETVDEATRSRVQETLGKLPLSFEENRGQVAREVKYLSRGAGYTLFLTSTEAVLTLLKADQVKLNKRSSRDLSNPQSVVHHPSSSVLRMKLSGANNAPAVTGESRMAARTNYLIGNDPQKWNTDVSRYERIRYSQVYPGIDAIYYGQQRELEYDFEVAPGADASRIALEFTGVKRVKIEKGTGDLVLKTPGGEVRQHKPIAYQEAGGERRKVESRYVVKGKRKVGIEVGAYDRTKRLVIDPTLSYSTYLGGDGEDYGFGIAVDDSGNVYVTGQTYSTDFPTLNPFQANGDGSYDLFITKLNPNASGVASLLYSTYLGGSDGEEGGSEIIPDASGIVYVAGGTTSSDFPTRNEFQTYQGGYEAIVLKLDTNASGTAQLLYSTYLGGTGDEGCSDIAIDSSGHAYVTGTTYSTDFPTRHEFQASLGGNIDAFAAKFDTNASGDASLLYSTYLGGSDGEDGLGDYGSGIALDPSGYVYVAGETHSINFPTLHQFQTFQGGYYDAFVTKFDMNASGADSLVYSTCLGGSNGDAAHDIAIDSSGHVYVAGEASSNNFPLRHQYQTKQDYQDAFVTKLDTNASGTAQLLYSTYLGGRNDFNGYVYPNDVVFGIVVDDSGNVYVTGITYSIDFPTFNQYQTDQGNHDAFVTKLNTNLSGADSLLYSTYLGGNQFDYGIDIAVDSSGNTYVVGITQSPDFPTLNQYQRHQVGNDTFVTKLKNTGFIGGRVTSDGSTALAGVTVQLGGSQTRTAITNALGSYSFRNLPIGGNYTVTPTKSGFTFIPSQQSFNDLQTNQTSVNFTAQTATISGRVTRETAGGAGLGGVTMTLADGAGFTPRTVTTASDGTYAFAGVPVPGNYTLTPSKANFSFSPAQIVLNNVTADQVNKNFVAMKTYAIIGVVYLGAARLPGVSVKLTSPSPAGFAPRTTTTNSGGAYAFNNLPAGRDYTVTAMKTGYQITPASQTINNLSSNQTAVNFAVKVYSITGRITRTGTTNGIADVVLTLTSPTPAGFAARTVRTNSTGTYTFTTLPAGRNYTIKPSKSGFTFTPVTKTITNLSNNIPAGAATNFTGAGP